MHLACVSSVSVIQVCSILISVVLCDYDYDNVKDSYEVPIFETCGTLLQDYWNASKLRTLNPEEREMFYDSYVLNKIEREDNRTLDLMKDEPTLDYSAINDTHEQTLFKTCGTLLQHYWENYDLRNLTSSERNFYYDESMMRKIEKEEKEVLQEHKDQEWLKKMEEKILNERIDSEERRRTTDKEYDDWVSPVPKTTVLRMSPMDNLFISQASNVSDTDISDSTFNREMKYGDAPKWLTDRFDQLQEEAIRKRDKKAIHDAVMYGFLPSTGFIVQSTATTRKRRMLTHRYERTEKTSNKVHRKTHHPHEPIERTIHPHEPIERTTHPHERIDQTTHPHRRTSHRHKRHIPDQSPKPPLGIKSYRRLVKRSVEKTDNTTQRAVRKRQKITNQDGVWIKKKWADEVRRGELELEREERREKKEAEIRKKRLELRKIKEEIKLKRLLSTVPRNTKFTRRKKETTTPLVITEDSWETTVTEMTATRRPLFYTIMRTMGTYGHFNLDKEITQPNAEQTEVDVNEFFEILHPSTQATKKWKNATTPRRKIRQSTTPYVEHTMPNRYNRTVYYWMYERKFALHKFPPPQNDSVPIISMEHTEEKPMEVEWMDFLFNTRRNKPTPVLNLTTVTISAREYENFLAKHQIYRNIYEQHWRLATMAHWNIGDTRFQKHDIKNKWGADFYDRRPYSSTRRQDNQNYDDWSMIGNFTKPDFKRNKYTFADSYDYHDPWKKHWEDPGHVTANWTTVDFNDMKFPIPPHQIFPNGTLKSAEQLIKEDYEFRKDMFGESCHIYSEEFAHTDELTKPSAEYIEHMRKQDRFFYPNVSQTIGPKHEKKSVYDIYESSSYEDSYRKWKVNLKKQDVVHNISLQEETRETDYVDPQEIIDIAYKHTTEYNPFKREYLPTEKGEHAIELKFKIKSGAEVVLP